MSSSFFKRTPARSATPAPVPVPPEMLRRMVGGRGEGTSDKPDDATLVAHSVLLDHDTHGGHGGTDPHAAPIKVDPAITKVAPDHQEQAPPVKEASAAVPVPEAASPAEELHEQPVKAEAEHAPAAHAVVQDPVDPPDTDIHATESLVETLELHEDADPLSAEEAQLLKAWGEEDLDALLLKIADTVAEEADVLDPAMIEQEMAAEELAAEEITGEEITGEDIAGQDGAGHLIEPGNEVAPHLDAGATEAAGHLDTDEASMPLTEVAAGTVVAPATPQADPVDDHTETPIAAKDGQAKPGGAAAEPQDRTESLSDMTIPVAAKQAAAPIARSALFPTQAPSGAKMAMGKMGVPTEAQKQAEALKAAEAKAALVTSLETKLKTAEGQATTILLKIGEIDNRIAYLSKRQADQERTLKSLVAEFNGPIVRHGAVMAEVEHIAWRFWEPKIKVFKQAKAERDATGKSLDEARAERVDQLKALQLKAIDVAQSEALLKAAKGPAAPAIEPGRAMETVKKVVADNNQAAQDSAQAREQELQALRNYDAKLKAFQAANDAAAPAIKARSDELASRLGGIDQFMTQMTAGLKVIKDATIAKAAQSKVLEANYKTLATKFLGDSPMRDIYPWTGWVRGFSDTIKSAAVSAQSVLEAEKTIITKNLEVTRLKVDLDGKVAEAKVVEREIEMLKLGSDLAIKVKTEALATALARPGVDDAQFAKLQEAARSGKIGYELASKNLNEASAQLKPMQDLLRNMNSIGIPQAKILPFESKVKQAQIDVTERLGPAYFAAAEANKMAQAKLAKAVEYRSEVRVLQDDLKFAKNNEVHEKSHQIYLETQKGRFDLAKVPSLEQQRAQLVTKIADFDKRAEAVKHLGTKFQVPLWAQQGAVSAALKRIDAEIKEIKDAHAKPAAFKLAAEELAAARAAWEGAAKKLVDTAKAEQVVTARNVDLLSAVEQALGGSKAGEVLKTSKDFRDGLKDKVGGPGDGAYDTSIAWKSETGLKPKITPPGTELSRSEKSGDPAADKARVEAAQQKKAVEDLKGMLHEKGVKLVGSLARDIGQDLAKRMALSAGTAVKVEKEVVLAGTVYRQTLIDGKATFEAMAQVTMNTVTETYRSDIGVAASAGFGLTVDTGAKLELTHKLGDADAKISGKAYAAAGVDTKGSAAANILGVSADVLARAYAVGEVSGMNELKFSGVSLESSGKAQAMTDATAKAGAKLGGDGVSVKASASAEAAARAEYAYGFKSEHVNLTTNGEVWAKARAEAAAKAEMGIVGGKFKLGGKLGAEAGAAVGIQETKTVKILGMQVEGTVGVYAGSIGGSASADISFKDGKLKWSVDIGAALGVGLNIKLAGSIDFAVVLTHVEKVLQKIGEAFGIKTDVRTQASLARSRVDLLGLMPDWR